MPPPTRTTVADNGTDLVDDDDDLEDLPEPDRNVKVFEIAQRDDEDEETPYPFRLVFTKGNGGEKEHHDFSALAHPGARGVLAMASVVRVDPDTGRRWYDLNGIMYYFHRVLVDGDADRLQALIERRDLFIEMDDLSEIYRWLVEDIYTGRPLAPPVASRRSRRAAGSRSTARRR